MAGNTEWVIRLPFIILGALCVPVLYKLLLELLGREKKKVALVASLLLMINPLHTYYSAELRMYSANALFSLLSWLYLLRAVKDKTQNPMPWRFFTLFTVLNVYSFYGAFFNLAAQWLFLYWQHRKKIKPFLVSNLVTALFFLPWLLSFFKQLAESGNLVPTGFQPASLVSGELPITLRWDYNSLANRDNNVDSATIEVVYPASGTIAGVYLCAINAYAPRPNAARLWMEHVYSDEGQAIFLSGYAKPVRFDDMMERGVIDQELLDKLPESSAPVSFPTLEQLKTGLQYIRDNWAKEVGITYGS